MIIANPISWVSLGEVLLSQIKLADSLGWGLEFRRLLFQDSFLQGLIQLLTSSIVDSVKDLIIANRELKLVSNNINPDAFDQFSFEAIQKL